MMLSRPMPIPRAKRSNHLAARKAKERALERTGESEVDDLFLVIALDLRYDVRSRREPFPTLRSSNTLNLRLPGSIICI